MPTLEEMDFEVLSPAPPATPEMISAMEAKMGLTLPDAYRQFLQKSNGGCSLFRYFRHSDGEGGSSFNQFYGVTPGDDDSYGIVGETLAFRRFIEEYREEIAEWNKSVPEPAQVIAIADNGGGDDLFLDYGTSPPSVKIMYRDPIVAREIAPSFDAFLNSLFKDDEED